MKQLILLCCLLLSKAVTIAQPYATTTIKEALTGGALMPSEVFYYNKDSQLVKKDLYGRSNLTTAQYDTIELMNPVSGASTMKIVARESMDYTQIGESQYYYYNNKQLELIEVRKISVDEAGMQQTKLDTFYVSYLKDGRSYNVAAADPSEPFQSGYTILVDKLGNQQKVPQGYKYTVDALGRLKTRSYNQTKWNYTYGKNKTNKMTVIRKGATPITYVRFYNNKNQIIKETIQEAPNKKSTLLKDFEYQDNRLVKMVYYDVEGNKEFTEYEYGFVDQL